MTTDGHYLMLDDALERAIKLHADSPPAMKAAREQNVAYVRDKIAAACQITDEHAARGFLAGVRVMQTMCQSRDPDVAATELLMTGAVLIGEVRNRQEAPSR